MKRRRNTFNLENLLSEGSETFRKLNSDIENRVARAESTKQKRNERAALVEESKNPESMVDIPHEVIVRIVRVIPDRRHLQDDDNSQGGCKELRDSIAALLSREGDSESDGFAEWVYDYRIEKGVHKIEIEIYEAE